MPGLQFLPFLSYQGKASREEGGGKIKLPSLPTPPQKKEKIWVKLYFCCQDSSLKLPQISSFLTLNFIIYQVTTFEFT